MSAVEQAAPSEKWVGQALRRKEDPRMITGRGRYVDDMVMPGMLYMAVVSLLDENPDPTEREVRLGLEGNLCRCTGYHNIVEAVKAAAGSGVTA